MSFLFPLLSQVAQMTCRPNEDISLDTDNVISKLAKKKVW